MPSRDESTADDGAIFGFWAFVVRRRQAGERLDLEDVATVRQLVLDYDAAGDPPAPSS